MERFRRLDWNPKLEDVLNKVFIKDERMERESVMYKIMRGDLKDPFEDMEADYEDVNVEQIKKYFRDDGEDIPDSDDESEKLSFQNKHYIPGIKKVPFNFPRMSHLSKTEQAICLRVFLNICNRENQLTTGKEQNEYCQYMQMKRTICEEQEEFLKFVKSQWDDTHRYNIKCNKFVQLKWQAKVQELRKLPRYYIEFLNIPLSVQKINLKKKEIKVTFISYLQQRSFSKVILPTLNDEPTYLNMDPSMLLDMYPPCVAPNEVTQHFKLPVSKDTYCESLAVENDADVVISSSGLKCLLRNVDPNHSPDSWLIPVVVKSHCKKNIIYIDKRLPPTMATVPQKNTWIYKYILKYYFIKRESKKANCTEEVKLKKAAHHSDTESTSSNDHLKLYEEDLYISDEDEPRKSDDLASGKTDSKIDEQQNISHELNADEPGKSDSPASDKTDSKIDEQQNVSYEFNADEPGKTDSPASDKTDSKIDEQQNVLYKLFKLELVGGTNHEHELKKHGIKEYKMLVRTKADGQEILLDNPRDLMLAPKMEHQLALGAEAITLEEGMHQWASLKFRPMTTLARVRIETNTSEVIQIERHTPQSLSAEIKRLYNVKAENSLSILHNIFDKLSSLTPGQYIMRYAPQHGPFVYVYETLQTDYRKDAFDLHAIYQSPNFETITKTPWPSIDTMMTTPAMKLFERMPAMFHPPLRRQKFKRSRPDQSKKNASVTNASVTNASVTNASVTNVSATNNKG